MARKKNEQSDGHRQRRPVDERTNGRGLVRHLVPKNVRLRSNDLVRSSPVDDFFYLAIIVMNPTEAERIHITMDPLAIVFLGTVAKTGTELRRLFLSRQYVDRISTSRDE